ncbi:MAG: hypothetical protein ABIP90_09490 [Vicinamibacterales bacterium]
MRVSLRRELWFLRSYVIASAVLLVLLSTAAFKQSTQTFSEINVGRINVMDADGTLRMVISNKDRMHSGVMDGVTIDRPRPVAGMLFFNDEGDEVGGLTFTGRTGEKSRTANAGLMFDQLNQDQTIGLSYSETDGRRTAGFQVWDRADSPLSDFIRQLNEANRITDATARDERLKVIRASAPPGPRRVFVGKNADRSATVSLADANGRPRLRLTVDAAGNPRIEFLDETGKVVTRIPQ